MVRTKYLSETEKRTGQNRLYRSEVWNGLGFSMLGDTIVYILAVQFGAGNLALGYIASAMYIVGFVLPAMTLFFKGKNVVKLQTVTWVLRGLVGLLYIPLLWMDGTPAVFLLLFVYTLFCFFRLLGVVLYDYTFKSITTNRSRGRVIGNLNMAFQASTILARFLNFIVTSIEILSGVIGLVSLQMIGVVANTFASVHVSKIPCRTTIEYNKGRTLFVLFKEAMSDRIARNRLIVHWIYMMVTVVMGLSVAFLSKEVGLASNIIFLYTIGVSLAVVASGSFCKFFSDRLGSRPLIIANGFGFVASMLGWLVVPLSASVYWFFVLGFLSNFFLSVINILIRRLIASIIPDDEGVGFNSMVNFVIAFLALFAGLA
ncbi:MAG: MFS transporter, partial [Sphaerochaetaceae bacterium]|nr:MFS transporter [Sphaerochaetaceae bacterium]